METFIGYILIVTVINYGLTFLNGLSDLSIKECLILASCIEGFILLLGLGVALVTGGF